MQKEARVIEVNRGDLRLQMSRKKRGKTEVNRGDLSYR